MGRVAYGDAAMLGSGAVHAATGRVLGAYAMAGLVDPKGAAEPFGIHFPESREDKNALVGPLALEWLDHDLVPRMILRRDLSIRWCNASAQAFLSDDPDISVSDGVLCVNGKANQERLADFMAAATSGSLFLKWEDRDDFLLLRVDFLPSAIEEHVVAVTASSRRWSEMATRFGDLEVAYNLTPREVQIVTMLALGSNVATIGTRIQCAVETVRRHLKNIYLKIGVSTREELLSRMDPFRQRS